jgi:predicted metalloprotease with PDZ domain
MMTSRWSTRSRSGYVGWLGLVAHEYFHAWNVKRLRPVELGPFDYEHEVYTTGLWMAEGVTSYYADLLLARAGLTTRDEFLRSTSAVIRQVQTTPGRLVQPVDAASYDAWIKSYRPDENSINTSVSYYTKGQVIGLLLDARVRAATGGARSLDDVMRLAYERFAGDRGFSSDELVATAGEVAGVDLTDWFATALSTTDELDYDELLEWFGLRFRPPQPRTDGNGPTPGWLGLGTRTVDGRLLVTQVRRDTPGHEAGVNVEDEILALDDYRVPPDGLNARLARYRAGDRISLLVARRDRLVQLEITLGAEPLDGWTLQIDPNATPVQAGRLSGWLD